MLGLGAARLRIWGTPGLGRWGAFVDCLRGKYAWVPLGWIGVPGAFPGGVLGSSSGAGVAFFWGTGESC